MAIGRISGPLLKSNLLRNGVDLAFETDLLYLDVTNRRIGVKTTSPQYALDVQGVARVTDLEITNNLFQIGNVTVDGGTGTISTTAQEFSIATADNTIVGNRVLVGDLELNNNFIENTNTNNDLFIRANGTGNINIVGNTQVNGNLHATGNISADGNITLGDADTDSIFINADIASDIMPDVHNTYNIGTDAKRWATGNFANVTTNTLTTNDLDFGNINLISTPGNLYYVSTQGDDARAGEHPADPVRTIAKALSYAGVGDTVYIYPGQYQEAFPLNVPMGVTVKGHSLRSVEISPTSGTQSNDAFHMQGDSAVEDVTIKDFYYNSGSDTGYGFKFAPNFRVYLRSPYIRNVTVITKGTTTSNTDPRGFDSGDAGRGALLDGSIANSDSREASMLFHAVTFITPGQTALKVTNGSRVEWLNCFTYFADKGIHIVDGTAGLKGDGKTRIKYSGLTGSSPSAGNTISLYDANGTLLANNTIESVDTNSVVIDGKATGYITPLSRNKKTVTAVGNAQITTGAPVKFGSGIALFDGTGDRLSLTTQTDFGFGTGDFSIECILYLSDDTGTESMFDFRAGSDTDSALHFYTVDRKPIVAVGNTIIMQPNVTLINTTFYHLMVTRVGTTMKIFVDGSQIDSVTNSSDLGTTKPLIIGSKYDGSSSDLQGRLDDIRVRKGTGVSANFTNPTAAAVVDQYTVLKLDFDGDNGSQIITDNDTFIQDVRFNNGATATAITLVDHSDFGGEIRSIASASVYGNYGIYGDGSGSIVYAIGMNLAYIGTGKDVTNDTTAVIQANEITANNNANIYFSTVDHKGDFRVGDLFRINQETGEVTFTNAEFLFNNNQGITFTDGVNTTIIDGTKVESGNIRITGNTISSISGDINLNSSSGTINLQDDVNITGNLDVSGNVTVGGNITLGDEVTDTIQINAKIDSDIIPAADNTYKLGTSLLNWSELNVGKVIVDDITIDNSTVQSTASNGNLNFVPNAAGKIVIDNLKFASNIISNDSGNIVLDSQSESVVVDSTGALVIPKGTTAQRPGTPATGMIRYNTDTNVFEAYDGQWTELGGVYDDDRDTYITPELTPGADDDTLRFYAGGSLVADVTANRFDVQRLEVDDISVSGNTLQTITTNQNLVLQANGGGFVSIENFSFNGNQITNNVDGAVTTLKQVGTGYFKIEGNGGFVIPVGNNANRHPSPETGMMRYNTVEDRVEIYDIGGNWVSVAGATGAVTFNDAEEIAVKLALVL
tara:strand:- start:2097 stop:5816 length:3720 start_codon:yes stop_codon:yes gene_type:complete